MILIENQQKYQSYHQARCKYLIGKEILPSNKKKLNLLILLWERLLKRKTSVLKSLNISDKKEN